MSTSTTALGKGVDPNRLEKSMKLLNALNPGLDPESVNKVATAVAKTVETIADSSENLDELRANTEEVKKLCEQFLPSSNLTQAQLALQLYKFEKERILRARNLSPQQQVEGDLDHEITEAAVQSIKKAQDLQQQTCKTCKTPNRLITPDSKILQPLLKRCSKCKTAMYCSIECQRKDWPRHKKVECLNKKN